VHGLPDEDLRAARHGRRRVARDPQRRRGGDRRRDQVHHTDCGLQKITDDEFKREVEAETGIRPPWAVEAFTDAAADVRQSIGRLKASPFVPHKDAIRGFVFDVATGRLNEVS
jgi:carbonic anhydrase